MNIRNCFGSAAYAYGSDKMPEDQTENTYTLYVLTVSGHIMSANRIPPTQKYHQPSSQICELFLVLKW